MKEKVYNDVRVQVNERCGANITHSLSVVMDHGPTDNRGKTF